MSTNVSYACFGCIDFANNSRTIAYINWACSTGRFQGAVPPVNWICTCNGDNASPDMTAFSNPIDDNVCWYDPLIPESADFLGIVIRKVSGIRASSFSRELIDGINGGTILQKPLVKGKQFAFEVYIYATSCEGMDYGFEWMRRVLEDNTGCPKSSSCSSCEGQELTLRVHCPDGFVCDDGTPCVDDDGLHKFITAGTVDGFTLVEDEYPLGRQNCCTARVATFTIATESPYSFAINRSNGCTMSVNDHSYERCFFLDCNIEEETICCPFCPDFSCDRCNTDPLCDCLPPLVLPPEKIGSTCFTQPMCRTINAFCLNDVPSGYDTALKISLFSGSDSGNEDFSRYGLRNIAIRIWENPNLYPCPDTSDAYGLIASSIKPCVELGVQWVPRESELVIDGTTERISLFCNGKCYDHSRRVDAISGSIFPLFTRCVPLIIAIEYDCLNVQSNDIFPAYPSSATVEAYRRFRI